MALRKHTRFNGVLPPDVVDRAKRAEFGDSDWYAGRLYPRTPSVEDAALPKSQEDRLGDEAQSYEPTRVSREAPTVKASVSRFVTRLRRA